MFMFMFMCCEFMNTCMFCGISTKMNVLNLEECELLTDSKYRAYVSQVERALKSFEYTSEWADLISALGKLNKVPSPFSYSVPCEFVACLNMWLVV